MDLTTIIEILKVGGPVLAFAIVLLYWTLRDKDRMANQLSDLNRRLLDLVENNTRAMWSVRDVLSSRPCLRGAQQIDGIGGKTGQAA